MSTAEQLPQRRVGGRYLLSTELGAGAMGTVWSAFDEVLQRPVAVKELKVPLGVPAPEAQALRERMLREARALGGLSHPNVITVFDVVDADGEPLVVLEMVPSRNLATLIVQQGTLTAEQAAVVGYATAAALRAAHRSGITHRDVKPANVLVADDGRVKLTDFGIARNVADAPMTTAGLVLGSPAYIAPEVAAGQPVRPAADLWGLGATLFAAIEGRPPYDVRGEAVATITEVVDGEVPRPRHDGPVADVIAALMVKDPDQRISLDEVRRRLRPLIPDPDDPLYPGSAEAPAIGPMTGTEDDAQPAAAAPLAAMTGADAAVPASPLAAAPGPLPWEPAGPVSTPLPAPLPLARPRPPVTRLAAAGLALAGATVVLAGTAGGWTAVRMAAGQSAMSTVSVATAAAPLVDHADPLDFRMRVPQGWTERREGPTAVRFVSPDDSEDLLVGQVATASAVTDGLTALFGAGEVGPLETAVPLPVGTSQLVYRTTGPGPSLTSWIRLMTVHDRVWVVRLTGPSGRSATVSAQLFTTLADGFTPGP